MSVVNGGKIRMKEEKKVTKFFSKNRDYFQGIFLHILFQYYFFASVSLLRTLFLKLF